MNRSDLQGIENRLATIESLLQRLPEIQAAVFIRMMEEYDTAKLQGKSCDDLWDIPIPGER